MKSIYQCPVCSAPLELSERQYRCSNNHGFDVAREGYVNLLLAHQRRSKEAGDSKAMLQSRRSFLERGYYDILPRFLSARIAALLPAQPIHLLDAGCGEGYYTGFIQRAIGERIACWGTDIAKPGIVLAAKRYPDIQFFVASSFRLPLRDRTIDVAIRIYAPGSAQEFARVLTPNGLLITVIPGKRHLFGLKQHLYDTPLEHDASEPVPEGFSLREQHILQDQIHLTSSDDIRHLLAMTPYYWHAAPEKQQHVAALTELTTEIEFVVNVYDHPFRRPTAG
ncbi:MAG: putative RNA methyltransferase [Pseudomonadota bacterium]